MRILIANLKHLYQCRRLWLAYPVLAVIMLLWWLAGIFDVTESLGLGVCLAVNWPVGLIVGSLMTETLVKPFAYCLPGHRATARRVVFLVGIVTNFLFSWLALSCHGVSVLEAPGRMAALFSAGLISYLSCVLIVQAWTVKERLVSFCVFALPLALYVRWPNVVDALLVRAPGFFIVTGLVFSAMVWRYLRGDARARVLCGLPIWGLGDSAKARESKTKRIQQMQYAKQQGDALPSSVESLFLGRMKSGPASSLARHVWGGLYLAFGPVLEKWKIALFSGLFIAGVAAYQTRAGNFDMSDSPGLWIAGSVLCFLTNLLRLPLRSNMLLPAGRRERCFGALAVVGVATMLISAALLFVAALADALHGTAPAMFGRLYDVRAVLLPLALVPSQATLNVLLGSFILQYLVFIVLAGFLIGLGVETSLVTIRFLLVASVCAWAIFVLLTHRICKKRCLVA